MFSSSCERGRLIGLWSIGTEKTKPLDVQTKKPSVELCIGIVNRGDVRKTALENPHVDDCRSSLLFQKYNIISATSFTTMHSANGRGNRRDSEPTSPDQNSCTYEHRTLMLDHGCGFSPRGSPGRAFKSFLILFLGPRFKIPGPIKRAILIFEKAGRAANVKLTRANPKAPLYRTVQ